MSKDLFQYLVNAGLIDQTRLPKLEQGLASRQVLEIERFLLKNKLVSPKAFLKAKSEFFHLPALEMTPKLITEEILGIIPEQLADNYKMVAFDKQDNVLKVAISDPSNLRAREAVEFIARGKNLKLEYFVVFEKDIDTALRQYGNLKVEVKEALEQAEDKFAATGKEPIKEELDEVIKSAPVSKMASVIFRHAVEGRASDIHIEVDQEKSRVRYRIDGKLHTSIVLPKYIHAALVSRIKVLANLKIDESRIPQDGRIRQKIAGKQIDFRVSTLPLIDNEKVVMRVLETSLGAPSFDELGFSGMGLKIIQKTLKEPYGLFLVTGPTGSGKSTTLFSALSELNNEEINITTLEDPVEYYIEGVNQSQINTKVGFTFATGLRSILRQDPDIIMVGEIRDNETVELAIHAGLTGHLVLATLHTNDAVSAIPRLMDMKAEAFLLSTTVNVVVAQRLVRKICEHCRQEIAVPRRLQEEAHKELGNIPILKDYWSGGLDNLKFYRGKGCSHCGGMGYQGRIAIFEVLEITDKLKEIIAAGYPAEEVKKEILRQEMLSMKQDGIIKALKGLTALEDILEVTAT
ncbi:GspE/PulE family protein [Patescibacteria group bacterium]|nr:GspE/PulE family protein [Patescibacteria group bacterium]MBU4511962.1 GspE/PulE family protein [Patescibacteria group bacterium]MCG2693366.1 GspE/PulE family protein [Candidatus Parcubacteria bacterium]